MFTIIYTTQSQAGKIIRLIIAFQDYLTCMQITWIIFASSVLLQ